MLGNEKNKEEIFTLCCNRSFTQYSSFNTLIPFEVPQSAVDIKIENENDFQKKKIKKKIIEEQGKSSK